MDWCELIFTPTAVTFRRSNAQLNACYIQPGQSGGPWPRYFITQTTEGIRAEDSDVTLVGSVVWGAFYESSQNPERVAVHVQDGTLRVGPTTTLRGGLIQGAPVSGAAIHALGTAQVIVDPRAVHTGNATGGNPLTPGYLHAIDHTPVTRNEPYNVRVFGPPGGFMLLAVGNHVPAGVPTPLGTLELHPNALAVIGAGALSAQAGHLEQTHWAWRGLPLGHVFAFQAAVIDPTGSISLTLPAPVTVGWEAGRSYP